ncbi:MAG: DoxX family protein, partial [Acidimicrobiales bacterium]|nr:DoxX family protein [Acidimicrobiales bacterium]
WEYVFILATIAAGLASTGPGEWSIDNAIDLAIDGWAGLAIAVVGGVGAAVATLAVFFKDPAPAA